jgi:hypothetical protein
MVIPCHSIVFINTTDAESDNDSLIEARNKRQFFTPDSLKPEVYLETCKNCDSMDIDVKTLPDTLLNSTLDSIQPVFSISPLDTLLCKEFVAQKKHESALEVPFKSKPLSGVKFQIVNLTHASLEYSFKFFELAERYGLSFNLHKSSGLTQIFDLWKVTPSLKRGELLQFLKRYLLGPYKVEQKISTELRSGQVWMSSRPNEKEWLKLSKVQKLEILVWIKKIESTTQWNVSDSTWAHWIYGEKKSTSNNQDLQKVFIHSKIKGSDDIREDILGKFSRFELKQLDSTTTKFNSKKIDIDTLNMSIEDYSLILDPSLKRDWVNQEANCFQTTSQCFDLFLNQPNLFWTGNSQFKENGYQIQQQGEGVFKHSLEIVGDNKLLYTPLLTLGYVNSKPFKWSIYNKWIYSEWVKGTDLNVEIENNSTGLLSHFFASQHFWNFENSRSPFLELFSEKWGGGVSQQEGNRYVEAEFKFSTGTIQQKAPAFEIYELEGFDIMTYSNWSFPLLSKSEMKKLEFIQGFKVGMNSFQYQQYQKEGAPLGLYLGFKDQLLFEVTPKHSTSKVKLGWTLSGGSYLSYKSLKSGEFIPAESYSGVGLDDNVNALFYQLIDESYLGRKSLYKNNFAKYFLKSEVEVAFLIKEFEIKYILNLWRGGLSNSFDELGELQTRSTLEASYKFYEGLNGIMGWGYSPNLEYEDSNTLYLRMNRYLPF